MTRKLRWSSVAAAALATAAAACGTSTSISTSAPTSMSADVNVALPASFTCPAEAQNAGAEGAPRPAGEKLQIVTTVAPITSIVANIAGDRALVTGIIPEGEDSHTYEPKPSAARVLAVADVVFVNGLQLEDPTTELAATNLKDEGQVVELGSLTITPAQYIYDFSFPEADGKPNPHLWTNPPMARCYATITAGVLAKADPANAEYYRENATAFEAKLDALDALMVEATASVTAHNRELLTYHDAYAYFADNYGWKVIGAIQVSNFEEPTPKEVAELIEQVKTEQVQTIFGSEVFPSPVLEQISNETGVAYVDTLRDDDLPGAPGDADHSYLGLMTFDFVTMVDRLGGDPTVLQAFDVTDVAPDGAEYPQ